MSLVEGFGDEVIHFITLVLIIALAGVIWWSSVSRLPQVRTILILTRRPAVQSGGGEPRNNTGVLPEPGPSTSSSGPDELRNRASSSTDEPNDEAAPREEADVIKIKLKYLNDDQRVVEGRRSELIGEFKRRHFAPELDSNKIVRLIFNGQVLSREDQSLQNYGLYDNCVVHCLVHAQQRPTPRPTSAGAQGQQDCNLGGVLDCLISIMLVFAWVCRVQYSDYFTLTTTAALVGLTGLYIISVVGPYLPNPEPVRPQRQRPS